MHFGINNCILKYLGNLLHLSSRLCNLLLYIFQGESFEKLLAKKLKEYSLFHPGLRIQIRMFRSDPDPYMEKKSDLIIQIQ